MSLEEIVKELNSDDNEIRERFKEAMSEDNTCDPRIIANYVRAAQKEKNFYRLLVVLMFIVGFLAGIMFG